MVDRHALARYLAGVSAAEESERVKSWLDAHPQIRARLASGEELPDDYEALRARGAEALLERSGASNPASKDDGRPVSPDRKTDAEQTPRWRDRPALLRDRRRKRTVRLALAALAVVVLSVAVREVVLDGPAPVVYASASGERMQVGLPDGSVVEMNVASRVAVSPGFGTTNRLVHLEGEAYFDVEPDSSIPFVVATSEFEVEVLGTAFNVNAYPQDSRGSVAVAEGTVAVEATTLRTGQTALIEGHSVRVVSSDVTTATAWRDGILVFRDASLEEVEHRLERWYSAEVHLASDISDSLRLDATIEERSLDEAAALIGAALGLTHSRRDNQISFSNSPR